MICESDEKGNLLTADAISNCVLFIFACGFFGWLEGGGGRARGSGGYRGGRWTRTFYEASLSNNRRIPIQFYLRRLFLTLKLHLLNSFTNLADQLHQFIHFLLMEL